MPVELSLTGKNIYNCVKVAHQQLKTQARKSKCRVLRKKKGTKKNDDTFNCIENTGTA